MRIVTLLFRRVGDSLLATPTLRAIKTCFPDAELCVICEPQITRVFAANPWINTVIRIPDGPSVFKLAAAAKTHGQPDILLDFLSDPRSALATRLCGARKRVGFARRGMNWAYTHAVLRQDPEQPIYSALHKLKLVNALGIDATDTTTEFYLSDSDHAFATAAWEERGWNQSTRVTCFFVHSRRDYKRWPLECFGEVIQHLREQQMTTPLVLATPGDEIAVAKLRARAGLSAQHILPVGDLGHLGAVLARCNLLLGNDGGPKHLAVALGVPTVTIFGTDSAAYWTPANSPINVAIFADSQTPHSSIRDVSPSKVFEAAALLLAAKPR